MEILNKIPNEIHFNVIKFLRHPLAEIVCKSAFRFERDKIMYKVFVRTNVYGSPFDRGSADSYYNRDCNHHKWIIQEGQRPIRDEDLNDQEIEEYELGYEWNEY